MNLADISTEDRIETEQFLCAIPNCSYNIFLNFIAFIHFVLNGKEISVTQHFTAQSNIGTVNIANFAANNAYQARDEQQFHGTYFFEKQLLEYVRQGSVDQIRQYLLESARRSPLNEGSVADTPIRQAKNIFIGIITLVGKDGAIPGGLAVEEVYIMIDTYIRECERLQSLEAIKTLQFNMIIDFTSRVFGAKAPRDVSTEIFTCMQFINSHINEPIGLMDVVHISQRSRAYISKRFKSEAGIGIGAYIMHCRLAEAKTLLHYTNKSIPDISNYLCFSSQPHFQYAFKKAFGITPAKFRQQNSA